MSVSGVIRLVMILHFYSIPDLNQRLLSRVARSIPPYVNWDTFVKSSLKVRMDNADLPEIRNMVYDATFNLLMTWRNRTEIQKVPFIELIKADLSEGYFDEDILKKIISILGKKTFCLF